MRDGHGLTYDTGALIAAERGDRRMWELHAAAIAQGLTPTVPAAVLAESWRGGPQAQLSRLLKGCRVEPLTANQARAAGWLASLSGVSDTVDLAVGEGALRRDDVVVTSDRSDMERIASSARKRLTVHEI